MRAAMTLLCFLACSNVRADAWNFQLVNDAFNGAQTYKISQLSESGNAALAITCPSGTAPTAYFATDKVVRADAGGSAQMVFSVDSVVIKDEFWQRSDTLHGAYTSSLKKLLKRLQGGSVLRVRAMAVGEIIDAEFSLAGINDSLDKLREHCPRL